MELSKYILKKSLYFFMLSAISLSLHSNVYAQELNNKSFNNPNQSNIIYKCKDSYGKITYLNVDDRSGKCERTDLSNPNKMMVVENHSREKRNFSTKQIANANVSSQLKIEQEKLRQEQFLRDQKRLLILNDELKNEKEQLKTIEAMLKNAGNDKEQLNKLEEMKKTHKRNIASLTKEIDSKKTSQKNNNVVNNSTTKNSRPATPTPIEVDIDKKYVENGEVPVNVLNTNPELLPTTLPQS